MLVLSGIALALGHWKLAIVPTILGGGAIAFDQFLTWRWTRHALDRDRLYTRRGWLVPSMTIAARHKLQSVELVQHPLARLRGYADVRFGLAGGNLRLRGLSVAEAERVRAAVLDSMAANDFSQIGEATPTGC